MKRQFRTFLSLLAGGAVVFFGSSSREGRGVSNAVLVLGLVAAVVVWNLTSTDTNKPVS